MQHRQLPAELKSRIRKYYAFYWSRQSVFDEAAVLKALPAHLRREVLLYLHRDMISKVPFFRDADISFILGLVSCLTPVMAAPGDYIAIAGEVSLYISMYLCLHIYREREREREIHIDIYIYINEYIHTYRRQSWRRPATTSPSRARYLSIYISIYMYVYI